ncbi:MAG: TetR/AcrR family transcriptional regulator [Sciscionella sp.]
MTARQNANSLPRSRGRRSPNRSDELVAIAAELFGKHGYHGVGVNDIAAAAGISGPALYRHFASKQDLLATVLLSALDSLNRAAELSLRARDGTQENRLPRLLRSLAELSVERRDITALWRWQGAHLSADGRQAVLHQGGRLLGLLSRELRAYRRGLPQPEAELLCWAALSVLGSVAVHRTRIGKRQLTDLLLRIALAVADTDLSTLPRSAPNGDARAWAGAATASRRTRRESLLTEATRLFRERGFHAVSIEEIGQAAGLAPASVYRHFSGKTDLLLTGCRRMADRLATDAARAIDTAAGPQQALRGLLDSYADNFTRNVDLVMVYTTELANLPGPERAELVRLQRGYVTQWVQLLMAVDPGLDEGAARVSAHAALTIVNDLARTRQVSSRPGFHAELVLLARMALDTAAQPSPAATSNTR